MGTVLKMVTLGLAAILGVSVIALVWGLPVMWLWNSTIPGMFNLHEIGFWQAVRFSLLCALLFKSSSSK